MSLPLPGKMPEPPPAATKDNAPAAADTASQTPLNDAFAGLEKLVSPPSDAERADGKQSEDATSAASAQSKSPDSSSNDDSGLKKTEGEKKPDAPEQKPVKAAELRAAYDGAKKRLADSDKRIADMERELGELKKAQADPAERKALQEKLDAAEKRRADLEEHMRFLDYRKSDEFQAKYERPYTEAWKRAIAEVSEMMAIDGEGTERPATANDMIEIANLPLGQAMALAKERFGELASVVMAHRKSVRELAEVQKQALEEAKTKASEWHENRKKEFEAKAAESQKRWQELNEAAVKKFPQWFAPTEGDDEGNTLLEQGFKLADHAFSGDTSNPQEMIKIHSAIRNKAAAFDRLALLHKRANDRVKELEAELAAFQESTPGKGDGKTEKKVIEVDWESRLDKLAK